MKALSFLYVLFVSSTISAQVEVTVDAGKVIRTLSGIENGINLDYLMDGTYLSPTISPAQSLMNAKAKLLRYPGICVSGCV